MRVTYQTIVLGICALCATLSATPSANGQPIYRCAKDGRATFQQVPCEGAPITPMAAPSSAGSGGLPWDGLRPGMSIEEVKRAVAGSQAEGARRLRKPGIVIAGITFDADYQFDDQGRLQSVFVDKSDAAKAGLLSVNDNQANRADFDKLTNVFRAKYGAEASQSLKSEATGFPGLAASADWSVGGTRIFVSVIPITATTSMLRIGYNPVRPR